MPLIRVMTFSAFLASCDLRPAPTRRLHGISAPPRLWVDSLALHSARASMPTGGSHAAGAGIAHFPKTPAVPAWRFSIGFYIKLFMPEE